MSCRSNLALVIASSLLWACGPAGSGTDGRALSTTVAEDAGANCPSGGQKVLTGVDLNGNGTLEPSEIQQVAYLCNAAADSAFCAANAAGAYITTVSAWNAYVDAGCTHFDGPITINAPDVVAFDRPWPVVSAGGLDLTGSTALATLAFPALRTLEGDVVLPGATALQELDLPALETVSGDFNAFVQPALARVNLPLLTSVGGFMSFYDTALTSLHLPRLASAGGFRAMYSPALADVSIPALASTEYLEVANLPLLTSLEVPALTGVTQLYVQDNAALASLAFQALTRIDAGYPYAGASIDRNATLATARFPALQTLGALTLSVPGPAGEVDLGALATVTESLYVSAPGAPQLSFPKLTTVNTLGLGLNGTLALPALTTVTRDLSIGTLNLTAVTVPELTSVQGALWVSSAGRRDDPQTPQDETGTPGLLAQVAFPKLTLVGQDLRVNSQSLTSLDLPVLAEAGAVFVSGGGPIEALRLPALARMNWISYYPPSNGFPTPIGADAPSLDLVVSGLPSLATLEAPLLSNVSTLTISGTALTALDLPLLGTAWGEVTIKANPALARVSLPALTQAASLIVKDDPALATLEVPALWKVWYSLTFTNLPGLQTLSLPSLAQTYSSGFAGYLTVSGNAALTSVSAASMTSAAQVKVTGNPALATLSLPALASVGSLQVTSNETLTLIDVPDLQKVSAQLHVYYDPALPQCQALAIQARLLPPFPTDVSVAYNDMSATCP